MMKNLGFPIYVKEILFHEDREAILENKAHWENLGVEFNMQDFKGSYLDISGEGVPSYTPEDQVLISSEYIRNIRDCRCKNGYTQLIVMRDGSIIPCYVLQEVIGNMVDGTYKPGYHVRMVDRSVIWD
jgi:hypothetical protein